MQRRDFLKALMAAAIVPVVGPVMAGVSAPANPYQKYIDALALYDTLVATPYPKYEVNLAATWATQRANDEARKARYQEDFANGRYDEFHGNANKLFVFLMANFKAPSHSQEEFNHTREMLDTRSDVPLDIRIRNLPPEFIEVVWPIALCKALLSEQKKPLNPKTIPAFETWVETYRKLIIS